MLSSKGERIICLDSPSQVRVLSRDKTPTTTNTTTTTKPISPHLSYANFVCFLSNDELVWGGGEAGLNGDGVIVVKDDVVLRRSRSKPLQGRIVCTTASSPDAKGSVKEEEIWSMWSDGCLVRMKLPSLAVQYFKLDGVMSPNDFLILPAPLFPDATSSRRPFRQIVVCGSSPGIASFSVYSSSSQDHSQQGKGLLAVAAAQALSSAMSNFARKWLMDSPEKEADDSKSTNKEQENNEEEDDTDVVELFPKCQFDDYREFVSLCQGKALCASHDTLGRIFVFHPLSLQVLRVLKGYRSPSYGFQKLNKEEEMLVVLAPLSRGNRMELWRTDRIGEKDDSRSGIVAFCSVPSLDSIYSLGIAKDSSHSRLALFSEKEFICDIDLHQADNLAPGSIEIDNFCSGVTTSRSLPQELPSAVRENADLVLCKFQSFELSTRTRDESLGIELYVQLLTDIGADEKRIGLLQVLKRFLDKSSQSMTTQTFAEVPSSLVDPISLARTCALMCNNEASQQPSGTYSLFAHWLLLANDNEKDLLPLNLLFNALLVGDVFLVREVFQALETCSKWLPKLISPSTTLAQQFVLWWISTPVELSISWKHSSAGSNALRKFIVEMRFTSEQFIPVLSERAKGKAQLARSELLLLCLNDTNQSVAFHRAFAVAAQLRPHKEAKEFTVDKLDDVGFLIESLSTSCCDLLDHAQKEGDQPSATNVGGEKCWERKSSVSDLIAYCSKKEILGDVISVNRNEFRFALALEGLAGFHFPLVLQSLTELEEEQDAEEFNQTQVLKLVQEAVRQLLQLLLDDNLEKQHQVRQIALRALAFVSSLQHKQRLIALVTAIQLSPDSELITSRLEAFVKSGLIDSGATDDEPLKQALDSVFRKAVKDLVDQTDDETLRQLGLKLQFGSGDVVARELCLAHYSQGKDVRGNECFEKITDAELQSQTAQEVLTKCRYRLAVFITTARSRKDMAPVLASIAPKTMSWVLASSSSAPIVSTSSSLQSTFATLNKIRPSLPHNKIDKPQQPSPEERCGQLMELIQTLMAT